MNWIIAIDMNHETGFGVPLGVLLLVLFVVQALRDDKKK